MRWWDRFPKKLTAFVIGVVVQFLPLPEDIKEQVRDLVIGFMGAQAAADVGASIAEKKKGEQKS